jgi:DNA repair photolyase
MEELKFKGKAIYATKGAAREYGRIGCNFYTGCPHECEYCYLKRGAPSKQLGGNVVQLKKCFKDDGDALEVFKREVLRHYDECKRYGVFFSFATDPMIFDTMGLTLRATSMLAQMGVPVKILTKCAYWIDTSLGKDLLELNMFDNIEIGFTLTGRDDMEPNASGTLERIRAMRILHASRFRTWASIEPVIDWESARRVIELSMDCCDHYKIGLRSGVKKDYYKVHESGEAMEELVRIITAHGRTVYLKESARRLMKECFTEKYCNELLSCTVDMDGKEVTV